MYYLKRLAFSGIIKRMESVFWRISEFNDLCDDYYNRTLQNPYCRYAILFMIIVAVISFMARIGLF